MAKNNYFYIMHRFNVDYLAFFQFMKEREQIVSISVGVNDSSYRWLDKLFMDCKVPDYITIDVANAWSDKCYKMACRIKNLFPYVFLIIGNVATGEATKDITNWGLANALKIGCANGFSCITRDKTGFSRPSFSAILECRQNTDLPIIGDGGIRTHGDIAKSLTAGSTMVMAGSLFSGYDESAGEIIEIDKRLYKEYFGNASEYNKLEKKHIEGRKILVEYKGSMVRFLQELQEDLRSSISYAGGKDLSIFKTTNWYTI